MPKVLVLFYSRTGRTATLADAIAEGARSVRYTEVNVRRIDDLASPDAIARVPEWQESRDWLARRHRTLESAASLADYDALVFGAPARYGVMAAELEHVLDQTGAESATGAFADKVGSAFTSVQAGRGGHETALWSMMTPMARLGR